MTKEPKITQAGISLDFTQFHVVRVILFLLKVKELRLNFLNN